MRNRYAAYNGIGSDTGLITHSILPSLVQTARRPGVLSLAFLQTLLTANTATAQAALFNNSELTSNFSVGEIGTKLLRPRCPSDEPSPYGPAAIFRKDQTNFRAFFRYAENFDLPVMFGDDPFGRG